MSGQDVVCTHERAEQETMLADGYCVECLLATLAERDREVGEARAAAFEEAARVVEDVKPLFDDAYIDEPLWALRRAAAAIRALGES